MRSLAFILLLIGAAGCATAPPPAPPEAVAQLSSPDAASALAFDPPAGIALDREELARESRAAGAYVGYEQSQTTYSYTYTRDRQLLYDRFNDYDRTVYSSRVGVTVR